MHTIQGQMANPFSTLPSAVLKFYFPRCSNSTGISGINSTQGHLPSSPNWILAHLMVTSSLSDVLLQAKPGTQQKLPPNTFPPMSTTPLTTIYWTAKWNFSTLNTKEEQ